MGINKEQELEKVETKEELGADPIKLAEINNNLSEKELKKLKKKEEKEAKERLKRAEKEEKIRLKEYENLKKFEEQKALFYGDTFEEVPQDRTSTDVELDEPGLDGSNSMVTYASGVIAEKVETVDLNKVMEASLDQEVLRIVKEIKENISKTYVGEKSMIDNVLIALLCGGHVLIEGVPGIGKTTLAVALAKSLGLEFKRIQFTPDTTPSDITGFNIYNPKDGTFSFNEGAVFGNIVIADEINRTNPKVQAGLLEAMAEHQVSVDGKIYKLPPLFLVVATQNPIEQFGTYELPEAQLDRFFMKFTVDYLPEELEMQLLQNDVSMKKTGKEEYKITVTEDDILKLQEKVKQVKVGPEQFKYIMEIIKATRNHKLINTGISTRSAIQLTEGAKAKALISGRDFVVPDDIRAMVLPMFNHKLVLTDEAKLDEISSIKVLQGILKAVPIPR